MVKGRNIKYREEKQEANGDSEDREIRKDTNVKLYVFYKDRAAENTEKGKQKKEKTLKIKKPIIAGKDDEKKMKLNKT